MYLSLGIGLIQIASGWNRAIQQFTAPRGAAFPLLVQLFTFATLILFIWLIARRRKNWARWLLLIITAVGTPGYVGVLRRVLHFEPILGVVSIVQDVLQLIALVLIFTGDAREWFRSHYVPPNPT
jgi:hypothetical protein